MCSSDLLHATDDVGEGRRRVRLGVHEHDGPATRPAHRALHDGGRAGPAPVVGVDVPQNHVPVPRVARRGLWQKGPSAVQSLQEGEQGFRLLRGKVTRVTRTRSSWWVELDGRVSLRIARADWKRFEPGMPDSLRGQTVEARGWLTWRSDKARAKDGYPPWALRIRHPYALAVRPPG